MKKKYNTYKMMKKNFFERLSEYSQNYCMIFIKKEFNIKNIFISAYLTIYQNQLIKYIEIMKNESIKLFFCFAFLYKYKKFNIKLVSTIYCHYSNRLNEYIICIIFVKTED